MQRVLDKKFRCQMSIVMIVDSLPVHSGLCYLRTSSQVQGTHFFGLSWRVPDSLTDEPL